MGVAIGAEVGEAEERVVVEQVVAEQVQAAGFVGREVVAADGRAAGDLRTATRSDVHRHCLDATVLENLESSLRAG